eukprot:NODE_3780_length_1987_cov_2.390323.p1 GENE.NODE_3780_length_1987_cov_2.390323~~NODE_3780_length_1987_cov_2.390323.p1  ORF type:complete len:494 (-),score=125.87 NODE_3780_length_1987_cov_2.390323:53-1534(-)
MCGTCQCAVADDDPRCAGCGKGHHLERTDACSGLPMHRQPLGDNIAAGAGRARRNFPWLCAECYAHYATSWWVRRRSAAGGAPPPRTSSSSSSSSSLRAIPPDAPPLGQPCGSLWELLGVLAAHDAAPAWLETNTWRSLRRFVRTINRLGECAKELRLPDMLSRVLRVLPRSRKYLHASANFAAAGGGVAGGHGGLHDGENLESALRAEAEAYLWEMAYAGARTCAAAATSAVVVPAATAAAADAAAKGDFKAAAHLHAFLERLDRDGGASFASTAAGSGTAEAGRGRDAVTVATVHAAKGSQWKRVLLLRFNDGAGFPLSGPDVPEHLEEERRLAYVAASRAAESLAISYVLQDEAGRHLECSRFLNGIAHATYMVEGFVELANAAECHRLASLIGSGCGGSAAGGGAGGSHGYGAGGVASAAWRRFAVNPRKPGIGGRRFFTLKRRAPAGGTAQDGAAPKRARGAGAGGTARERRAMRDHIAAVVASVGIA